MTHTGTKKTSRRVVSQKTYLENIRGQGVDVILWTQKLHPQLDPFFKSLTFTGDELFFMQSLYLLYWCLDRDLGAHLLLLFTLSHYTNSAFKVLTDQPRPFQCDPRVWAYDETEGGGFPSGHTQNAVAGWGYLALRYPHAGIRAGVLGLTALVPLSRVYLGVHYPHDVVGGYVLGALLLFTYARLSPPGGAWLSQQSLKRQMALLLSTTLLMASLFPDENAISLSGTLLGLGTGLILERRQVKFDVANVWWKRVLRYVLGMGVLVGLWRGLKHLLSSVKPRWLAEFIRYGALGFWGMGGAPWIFARLGLVETETRPDSS